MIGAEGGANLGISLAAYHSWLGSGKTEELGKLPFAFGGSIIGTSPLVAIPVGTTRFTLGLIGAIGDAAIDQFQDPAMPAALLGPNRNRIFKYLSDVKKVTKNAVFRSKISKKLSFTVGASDWFIGYEYPNQDQQFQTYLVELCS